MSAYHFEHIAAPSQYASFRHLNFESDGPQSKPEIRFGSHRAWQRGRAARRSHRDNIRVANIADIPETRQYQDMSIRIATPADVEGWVALRAQLWRDTSLDQHRNEAAAMLAKSPEEGIAFLDVVNDADIRAFAEAALRNDHVNGCETSPVAFLEGIFVHPDDQGSGIGRQLWRSVQSWAQERGCSELASDAHLDNEASHAFHRALGFEETSRVVYFRKPL